jgi:ribosome-associated protein
MTAVTEIVKVLEESAVEDIKVLDIRSINPVLCDYMIIGTGYTSDHILSVGEKIVERFGGRLEGTEGSVWVLVDLGDMMVHLFTAQAREFYGLEELYAEDT